MRIYPGSLSGARLDPQHEINAAHVLGSGARSAPAAAPDANEYPAAAEFAQLVARVDETEEVRPELIEEVSRRLAAGLYDTNEAAEGTAEAILQTAN